MIQSMTAFARSETQDEAASLAWEIKSVNHRYLDISIRLPENLKHLEIDIRNILRKRLTRGKIECMLRVDEAADENQALKIDAKLISQLTQANQQVEQILGVSKPISAIDVLKWPGVVSNETLNISALEKPSLQLFDEALSEFISCRKREGDELHQMITERLAKIEGFIAIFRKNLPLTLQKHREKLQNRLEQILEKNADDIDQNRLEQELVIFAQKIDIEEELDRLEAHTKEVQRVLQEGGAMGRRLDFLMQELNREANTTGSKSSSAEQTQAVVDLKVCIEQMREQIQNIE